MITNHYNLAPKEEKSAIIEKITKHYFQLVSYCLMHLGVSSNSTISQEANPYQNTLDFLNTYFLRLYPNEEKLNGALLKYYDQLSEEVELRKLQLKNCLHLFDLQQITSGETYAKFIHEKVQLEPTHDGYFGLGNISLDAGHTSEAISFYKQAMELDVDLENSDQYLLKLALAYYKNHEYNKAFDTAKKVGGQHKGEALVICGDSVAATAQSCGDSSFLRNANYWLAADYFVKAMQLGQKVDPAVHLKNAPTDQEIFEEGYSKNDVIKCICWEETTIVR